MSNNEILTYSKHNFGDLLLNQNKGFIVFPLDLQIDANK